MSPPAWMQAALLGNPVRDWAVAFGWALGATVAVALLRRLVVRRLATLAARTNAPADDTVIEAVRSISKTYVLLIAIGVALMWLDRTTLSALSFAGRLLLWITVILIGLEASGFEVKTLLTGLGVGGIVIALALVADAVKVDGRATLKRAHLKSIGITGCEVEASVLVPGIDFIAAHDIRPAILLGILDRLEHEGIALSKSALVAPVADTGVKA